MNQIQRIVGFPAGLESLFLFQHDLSLKSHPDYTAAKAGSSEAALNVVFDLAAPWLHENRRRFHANMLFVAPHAQEASGDNAIPQTLVSYQTISKRRAAS